MLLVGLAVVIFINLLFKLPDEYLIVALILLLVLTVLVFVVDLFDKLLYESKLLVAKNLLLYQNQVKLLEAELDQFVIEAEELLFLLAQSNSELLRKIYDVALKLEALEIELDINTKVSSLLESFAKRVEVDFSENCDLFFAELYEDGELLLPTDEEWAEENLTVKNILEEGLVEDTMLDTDESEAAIADADLDDLDLDESFGDNDIEDFGSIGESVYSNIDLTESQVDENLLEENKSNAETKH